MPAQNEPGQRLAHLIIVSLKEVGAESECLLAKPGQSVQYRLWPEMERSKRLSTPGRVHSRWCQPSVSATCSLWSRNDYLDGTSSRMVRCWSFRLRMHDRPVAFRT
jgi:hypothetical protein